MGSERCKNHPTNIKLHEARKRLKSKGYKKKATVYTATLAQYLPEPDEDKG